MEAPAWVPLEPGTTRGPFPQLAGSMWLAALCGHAFLPAGWPERGCVLFSLLIPAIVLFGPFSGAEALLSCFGAFHGLSPAPSPSLYFPQPPRLPVLSLGLGSSLV